MLTHHADTTFGGDLEAYSDDLPVIYNAGIRAVVCLLNIPGDRRYSKRRVLSLGACPFKAANPRRSRRRLSSSSLLMLVVSLAGKPAPLAVFCEAGAGRTGIMIACYPHSAPAQAPQTPSHTSGTTKNPSAVETEMQIMFLRRIRETTDAMSPPAQFQQLLDAPEPILALAPMQDVTDLPFWKLMAAYGGADVYYTEYFRVHPTSNLEKWILESIVKNPTGQPVVAQMIGNDIPSLVRSARELQQYPIAAVDLNLGCPAPVVYRKCAGGGLLREPKRVDAILGALRDAISIKFTVKTRIGFDSPAVFRRVPAHFLPAFPRPADRPRPHGEGNVSHRSALRLYRARRAIRVPCPVLANGNVYSARKAGEVLELTGARGFR